MPDLSNERLSEIAADADNFYRDEIKAMASELLERHTSQPVAWTTQRMLDAMCEQDTLVGTIWPRATKTVTIPLYAASPAQGEPVAVKGLEWVQVIPGRLAAGIYVVERVYLDEYCWKIWTDKPAGIPKVVAGHLTLEQSKAAAQADYEQRIRSALSPAPSLAVSDTTLGFILAILGADTATEAGAVWEENPGQRTSARTDIAAVLSASHE